MVTGYYAYPIESEKKSFSETDYYLEKKLSDDEFLSLCFEDGFLPEEELEF